MFDELALLIETVASVPELAVWLVIGFLAYKLALAASIAGSCLVGWKSLMQVLEKRIAEQTAQVLAKERREFDLSGYSISGCEDALRHQITRLAGKGLGIESNYIHRQSVDWLRKAIDAQELKDEQEKKRDFD